MKKFHHMHLFVARQKLLCIGHSRPTIKSKSIDIWVQKGREITEIRNELQATARKI